MVPALAEGGRLLKVHGDTVVVVGYGCYLRVPLFPPQPRGWQICELSLPLSAPLFQVFIDHSAHRSRRGAVLHPESPGIQSSMRRRVYYTILYYTTSDRILNY